MSEVQQRLEKQHNRTMDFFKHLCTLSAGSILIVVVFFDRLQKFGAAWFPLKPSNIWAARWGLGFLVVCLATSLFCEFLLIVGDIAGEEKAGTRKRLIGSGSLVAAVTFALGFGCLVLFVLLAPAL